MKLVSLLESVDKQKLRRIALELQQKLEEADFISCTKVVPNGTCDFKYIGKLKSAIELTAVMHHKSSAELEKLNICVTDEGKIYVESKRIYNGGGFADDVDEFVTDGLYQDWRTS